MAQEEINRDIQEAAIPIELRPSGALDDALELGNVEETALIPVVIRAMETERFDARIYDEKAVEIVHALNIDTGRFDKFMSHEGVVARTLMIDLTVEKLLDRYPDAVILNLGCGLDNRFARVYNGSLDWYNIDQPDMMQLRSRFFPEEEHLHETAADLTEDAWSEGIPADRTVIVIAEGLLMYFSQEQVQDLLQKLTDTFPKGYLIAELMPAFVVGKGKHHDTLKSTSAEFCWGVRNGSDVLSLNDRLDLIRDDSLNVLMHQYTKRAQLMSAFCGNMNNRIAVYRWPHKEEEEVQPEGSADQQ